MPVPCRRASRSGAWSGEEHGGRSISASSGSSAAHTATHSSAPCTSPDGEETATSASSSRTRAPRDLRRLPACTHGSMGGQATTSRRCPSCPRWRSSPGASPRRCRGDDRVGAGAGPERAEDVRPAAARARRRDVHRRAPAREAAAARRRHAGARPADAAHAPDERRPAAAVRQARVDARPHARAAAAAPGDRELRVREFGTKQARVGEAAAPGGPGGRRARSPTSGRRRGPTRRRSRELLASPRPLHSLLRDQQVIAGIGRTWVDEILHAAQLSPFKRGDDLSGERGRGAARRRSPASSAA